jgi:flagellar biosynthesis/type III secretory pathway M-ring protein FliF/YscJ
LTRPARHRPEFELAAGITTGGRADDLDAFVAQETCREIRVLLADIGKRGDCLGTAENLGFQAVASRALLQEAVDQQFHQMNAIARDIPTLRQGIDGARQQKVIHAAHAVDRIAQTGRDTGTEHGREDHGRIVGDLPFAVVINRGRVMKLVGEPFDQAKYDGFISEMQKIVASAAGLDETRGDTVNVTAMDFLENQLLADAATGESFMDIFMRNMGSMINALAFVVVAFLIVWLGFRPLIRAIGGPELAAAQVGGPAGVMPLGETAGLELPDFSPPSVGGPGSTLMEGFGSDFGFDSTEDLLTMDEEGGGLAKRVKEGPERRLARMVDLSEERAAKILRKWASNEKAA